MVLSITPYKIFWVKIYFLEKKFDYSLLFSSKEKQMSTWWRLACEFSYLNRTSLVLCFQESPRKRVTGNDDGPGRPPEVKAIQQSRRLLANARERTRVHTISAAFEALRKQVRLSIPTHKKQLNNSLCTGAVRNKKQSLHRITKDFLVIERCW